MGLFDAAAGIFQGIGGFIQDFASTTFSSIGERFQGGTLSAGAAAGAGTRLGATFGNVLADVLPGLAAGALAPTPPPIIAPAGTPAARPRFDTSLFQPRLSPVRAASPLDLFGGLTDPLFMEALRGNVLDPFGLPSALGRLGTQIFGGDEMPFHTQALPGGFQSPVPAAGRIFTPHQNLVTGAVTVRAAREVQFMNPVTGKIVTYLNAGRPVLFTGDFAACKRVNRIAARARRRRPR